MIKIVLFDIDGTLIRTGGAGVKAFERTSELVFGIPEGTRHLQFAGRTDSGLVSEFLQHHGLPDLPENRERFLDSYTHLLDYLLPHCPGALCPGVDTWLAELQALDRDVTVGLLTGNTRLGAEIKLRHYGLWGGFKLGAFGCDHPSRNRLAEIALARASQQLGREVHGSEILVIGDTPLDIECARAIQAPCLAVATGNFTRDQLAQHHPTLLLEQLDHMPAQAALQACAAQVSQITKASKPRRKTKPSLPPPALGTIQIP